MITASSMSGIQWAMAAFATGFVTSAFAGTRNMLLSGLIALTGIGAPLWLLFNLTGSTLFGAIAAFVVGAVLGHTFYKWMAAHDRLRQDKEADAKRKNR